MNPIFSSLPCHSSQSQIQTDGTKTTAQQVMPSNHSQGNPTHLLPNSGQIKPHQLQMGVINPQIAARFNNPNTAHLTNANLAMPNRQSSSSSSSFMNAPNQLFHPFQNGIMPPLHPAAGPLSHPAPPQFYSVGFTPQQNMNSIPINQMNTSQPNAQLFAHNSMNLTPYLNHNFSLPNGQFCLLGPLQNMSQFVQMQIPNYAQLVPGNPPLYQNQVSQVMVPQNPTFAVNQQFGLVHSNGAVQHGNQEQHRFIPSAIDVNATKQSPNTTPQLQGNPSVQLGFGSVQPQPTHTFRPPVFTKSQGSPGKANGVNNLNTNWKNSQNRNNSRHPKREAACKGFMKSQFHHSQNAHGKFRFHNESGGKEYNNDGARKSGTANSTNQNRVEKKRSLSLNYTEQEIQLWREERKKNYPSKANMEKKLTEQVTNIHANLRLQQLKEILAKQAELGVEVAEIPSYYLSDSEKQVRGRAEDKLPSSKKGRFQNKFKKRGRFHQNNRFAKKQRSAEDYDSSIVNVQNNGYTEEQRLANNNVSTRSPMNNREPTLLRKLLSVDLRREKGHLLQIFRFMVMNSFLKDWPEKPLRFPLVTVKETLTKESNDYDDGKDEMDALAKDAGGYWREEGSIRNEVDGPEEEEGEIID